MFGIQKKKSKLRNKFILYLSLIIAIVILGVLILSEYSQRKDIVTEVKKRGASTARNLARISTPALLMYNYTVLEQHVAKISEEADVIYAIIVNKEGVVAAYSNHPELVGTRLKDEISNKAMFAHDVLIQETFYSETKEYIFDIAAPVYINEGLEKWGLARIGLSKKAMEEDITNNRRSIILFGLITMLIGWLAAIFVASRITKPLSQLAAGADAISKGDLNQKIFIGSLDEIGELGNTFNRMSEQLLQNRDELEKTNLELRRRLEENSRLYQDLQKAYEELKDAQDRLIQSEKLSALGEMISGVAHELNNPLSIVAGYSQLVSGYDCPPKIKKNLEIINTQSLRCSRIVNNLLTFARKHQAETITADINEILEGTLELQAYQLRMGNVEVLKEFDKKLPKTMADPHQMQQVFFNIINNAFQAMISYKGRGKLIIKTEHQSGKIIIKFRDEGPGISEENLKKIFDPFFTTKKVGEGTGLGLSICYGIVKNHGGEIYARSKMGEGSTFIVELPIKAEDKKKIEDKEKLEEFTFYGKKAMVVDDERGILNLLSEILKNEGIITDTAENGNIVLERIPDINYDVLILDIKMPEIDGITLYNKIREEDDSYTEKVIFVTGDSMNSATTAFLKESGRLCIKKPFKREDILEALRKIFAKS